MFVECQQKLIKLTNSVPLFNGQMFNAHFAKVIFMANYYEFTALNEHQTRFSLVTNFNYIPQIFCYFMVCIIIFRSYFNAHSALHLAPVVHRITFYSFYNEIARIKFMFCNICILELYSYSTKRINFVPLFFFLLLGSFCALVFQTCTFLRLTIKKFTNSICS